MVSLLSEDISSDYLSKFAMDADTGNAVMPVKQKLYVAEMNIYTVIIYYMGQFPRK